MFKNDGSSALVRVSIADEAKPFTNPRLVTAAREARTRIKECKNKDPPIPASCAPSVACGRENLVAGKSRSSAE